MISVETFQYLVFNSLFIIGLHKITREGMLLEKAGTWAVKILGEFWSKPVTECPPCMASVWGLLFYFIFVQGGVVLLPFYLLTLVGLNYLLMHTLDK